MSERRTYEERRSYSARVMKWRKAVYETRDDMTNGCRVLLLRLSDDMDANRVVSVPRSTLAEDLGVAPARITEGIKKARGMGFLDIVQRGRPGITATYKGTFPDATKSIEDPEDGTPQSTSTWYARADHKGVRPGVPQTESAWYALAPTQEVVAPAGIEQDAAHYLANVADKERACVYCGDALCDLECLLTETDDGSRWTA